MKYFITLFIMLGLFTFSSLFAQETKNKDAKEFKPHSIKTPNEPQDTGDSVTVKDNEGKPLMTVTDEGDAGSIKLWDVGSSLSGNKLYNWGGNLFWGGSQLGTAGNAGGWTDDGTVVRLNTSADKVAIGTTNPGFRFEVEYEPPSNNINPIALFQTTGSTSSTAALRVQNTSDNYYNFGMTQPGNNNFAIAYNVNISQLTDLLTITPGGNVGIGTTTPSEMLEVAGQVKITGGSPGEGKVLTSDATGLASWETSNSGNGYSVGDLAQGGIVFWVNETGEHGLAAAETDQSTGVRWYAGTFGHTRAKGDGPFSGEMNTAIIIAAQVAIGDDNSTYAARICAELQVTKDGKTYGDWYLPSKEELNLIYENLHNQTPPLGGFTNSLYWSSTENDNYSAWYHNFNDGNKYEFDKQLILYVRAVRAF